jgi:hypothetical protein
MTTTDAEAGLPGDGAWGYAEKAEKVWAWCEMTQQYLAGELSLLLAQLRTAATDEASACGVDRLRREAETMPLSALASVTVRAIACADVMCWGSVAQGDTTTFDRQAAAAAKLHEFGVCAGLLAEVSFSQPPSSER